MMDHQELDLSPEMAVQWKTLREKGVAIPQRPAVLQQIETLSQSAGFHARHLASLIRQDPGSTARLLAIVNSPAYGLVEDIEKVEDAVAILGVDRALNLCRAVFLRDAIGRPGPALEIFWDRSAIIAELTAAVAYRQRVKVSNDLSYLTGLFHACGVIVLAKAVSGYGEALVDESAWMYLAEHDRKFGVDHIFVSYLVSRHWRLPEPAAEGILQQRGFAGGKGECVSREPCANDEANPQCAGLSASLQLAQLIYSRMFLGCRTSEWEATRTASLATLGMTEEELEKFA
jgi:HD-like signal output (HDOD) protein